MIIPQNSGKLYYTTLVLVNIIVLSAFFVNSLEFQNATFVYPVISPAHVIAQFASHGIFVQIVLLVMLYPYWIALVGLLLAVLPLEGLLRKTAIKTRKYPYVKDLVLGIVFLFPFLMNCYLYFGQYILPIKHFFVHVLGTVLFALFLFRGFFYFYACRKFDAWDQKIFSALAHYTFMGVIGILMLMVICLYYGVGLLLGIYMLLIGNIGAYILFVRLLKMSQMHSDSLEPMDKENLPSTE